MAKVYAPPFKLRSPNIDSRGDRRKQEEEYCEKVRAWCTEHGSGPCRGEILRFPVADGHAQYMVINCEELIHLPLGDAWQIPDAYIRGLRSTDIAYMVEFQKRFPKLVVA